MPAFEGQGYGYEMTIATSQYAREVLKINKLVAITDANNVYSIKLLNKIGLQFEKAVLTTEGDTVQLFS
ncbi:MAG: hypothetical protein DRI71_04000 [Bacteroidetes bacterium]|nr:MAG: hypothetical protein DRI71_04000 [Bacteroidota bacterium]